MLQLMEFEGEWAFDSKDGAGTMKKKNGSVFRGYFKMDQALGGGELLFADGNSYQVCNITFNDNSVNELPGRVHERSGRREGRISVRV
eukprot:746762-Hanusia_phi.AAC.9